MTAVFAMAGLALPTAWLLSLDEEGHGPWILALVLIALSAYSLPLGMFGLSFGMIVWLVLRQRRNRRELVRFVNERGWKPVDPPPGFTGAYEGQVAGHPGRVLLGVVPLGRRSLNPVLGFQRLDGDWPGGWEAARKRRGGLFPQADLPLRVEPGLLVFEGVPRVAVLRARLTDLERSLAPDFDWALPGRRRKLHPAWFWGLALAVVLVGSSQWIAWQKLRVFPAEPSLLLRSFSSLPRILAMSEASTNSSLAVSQDRFAVGGEHQSIELFDLNGQPLETLPNSSGWRPVAFSSGDVAACHPEGRVRLWPDRELGTAPSPLALAAAGSYVACGGRACEVVVFRREGGVVARMTRPMAPVTALACRGERALCGTEDGSLYLFELATARLLAERPGDGSPIRSVAFAGGGVVSVGAGGCLTWTEQLIEPTVLSGRPASAGAAADGLTCVGYPDGTIEVFRAELGTLRLVGHQAPITSLALSPDGKRLYSGSNDNSVKIWRLD